MGCGSCYSSFTDQADGELRAVRHAFPSWCIGALWEAQGYGHGWGDLREDYSPCHIWFASDIPVSSESDMAVVSGALWESAKSGCLANLGGRQCATAAPHPRPRSPPN